MNFKGRAGARPAFVVVAFPDKQGAEPASRGWLHAVFSTMAPPVQGKIVSIAFSCLYVFRSTLSLRADAPFICHSE